jgi:hypothetical protein
MDLPASRPLSTALIRHGVSLVPMAWGAAEIHGTLPALGAPFTLLDFPVETSAEAVRFPIGYLNRHIPVVVLVAPEVDARACLHAGACAVLDRTAPPATLAARLSTVSGAGEAAGPPPDHVASWLRDHTFTPTQRLLLSALLPPSQPGRRLDLRAILGVGGQPMTDRELTRTVTDLNTRLVRHGWRVQLAAGAGYQIVPLPTLGRPASD